MNKNDLQRQQDATDTHWPQESIPFRGFNKNGDLRVYYHGILPHWRQSNCTYFVTFRLADALPAGVIREFKECRDKWLQARGISIPRSDPNKMAWETTIGKLSKSDQRLYEQIMAKRLNQYLDAGYGRCILRQPKIRLIVAEALTYFHGQRVLTGDFVVMPNHVHVLMRPLGEHELEAVLHSIKSFTANVINQTCGTQGSLWMRESYDHIVRDCEQLEAFQRYIASNPKKARLAANEYTLGRADYTLEG